MTDQPLEPDERAASQEAPVEESTPPPHPDPDQPDSGEPASARASGRNLWRSRDDRVIAGVCGGLGAYLGVDPVLVRIAAVILIFAGGAGIVLYGICWLVVPEEPERLPGEVGSASTPPERSGAVVLGFAFVVLGAFFLVDELWPDFLSWKYIWPVALIAVGLAVLLREKR